VRDNGVGVPPEDRDKLFHTLRAKVPNLDDPGFARFAGEAEKNCPVSKVLNATITLDAKLV
jgi:lipoyl-dependent peroxiredoxin